MIILPKVDVRVGGLMESENIVGRFEFRYGYQPYWFAGFGRIEDLCYDVAEILNQLGGTVWVYLHSHVTPVGHLLVQYISEYCDWDGMGGRGVEMEDVKRN